MAAKDLLRKIPSVDQILAKVSDLVAAHGRELVTNVVRQAIDDLRARLRGDKPDEAALKEDAIRGDVVRRLEAKRAPKLCRVIHATGVILNTGLGRAVLPKAAIQAIASEQSGYSLLEVDRATGDRNHREVHIVELLREISGAEATTVVNNNAGATLISLAAMAAGREVIVARGQLVEIGGSFRIPDVMEQSGCRLVEVGTTNKVRLEDYKKKIGPNTALLLRVHPLNYRIVGFTEEPSLEELVALGKKHNLPVMDDLGSGAFVDLAQFGIRGEPTVQDSVKAGADVITFSGDKLLGGPQAGLIVGRKKPVATIRRHPLFRALRIDKLKLTALEATLKLYLDHDRLLREHPTLRMLAMGVDELERRALELAAMAKKIPGWAVEILDDASQVGGGSVPGQELPTKVVALRHAKLSLEEVDDRLRAHTPCIWTRVQRDRVLVDVRTLLDGDIADIAAALAGIA